MRSSLPGRHELGQNFLVDRAVLDRIVRLVRERPGPIVEWGTGNGAITLALSRLGRPLEGIEIDPRRVRELKRKVGPHVCISEGDILRHAPPAGAVLVSNVPFYLTTPVLRHLLRSPHWSSAVLITQWEVARKRAGVGGATQLTAQWWPWYAFGLDRKITSRCLNLAAQCKKLKIPITTFMIASDPYLQRFVNEFTETNNGKAFFASLDRLGSFIFRDFESGKRKTVY